MKFFSAAAKIGVSALLLWLIFRTIPFDQVSARREGAEPALLAAAFIAQLAENVLLALRWRAVSRGLLPGIDFGVLLRYCLTGLFFNQVLPSAIGGDGVRVWLLYRHGTGLREAAHSVLSDRAAGLLILLLLVALTLPFHAWLIADPLARAGLQAVALAGLGGFCALLLLAGPWAHGLERYRVTRIVRDLARTLHQVFLHPTQAIGVFLTAFIVQLVNLTVVYLLAKALGLPISFLQIAVLLPPVHLFQMIPISIGGWGLREGLFILVMGFIGIPADGAVSLSLAWGLVTLTGSLPGAILLLTGRQAVGAEAERATP